MFLVLRGVLRIGRDPSDGGLVDVHAGEFFVVPRGLRHNTSASEETRLALIGTVVTQHTGDQHTDTTRSIREQLEPIPNSAGWCDRAAQVIRMSDSTHHRLRKHADYQRVYNTSRKVWAQQLAYFSVLREPGSSAAVRSETPGTRVGLTVPKALGKAVDRNRIKRRLRELVRKHLSLAGGLPVDVVLHPKRTVLTADTAVLDREIAQILQAVRGRPFSGSPRPKPGPRPASGSLQRASSSKPSRGAGR